DRATGFRVAVRLWNTADLNEQSRHLPSEGCVPRQQVYDDIVRNWFVLEPGEFLKEMSRAGESADEAFGSSLEGYILADGSGKLLNAFEAWISGRPGEPVYP